MRTARRTCIDAGRRQRPITADYRVGADSHAAEAGQVPGEWYVYDVAPLAGGVIVLWVAETGAPPTQRPPLPFPSAVPIGTPGS